MVRASDDHARHRSAHRICLGLLVLAWGIQAIVTQSLLVREALVLMFGSELAWGIILFAWLFGIAVGAALGGWIAPRLRRPEIVLVCVLLLLSAVACAELWLFRGARAWLGVQPGELLPLTKTALAAVGFVSPLTLLIGMSFPVACSISTTRSAGGHTGAGPLAGVYAIESAGSLVGGAAFSFWAVEHLAPIQTALLCGAITAAAAAALLAVTSNRRLPAAALATVALAAVILAATGGETLNHRLVLRRWQNLAPGYTLCAEAESKYQNLAVGSRAGQYTLYCDGHVAADFPDPYSFVPLAHFWMCQHPAPRRVLVLGGGAEGLLAEILRHPVEHIDYVEPDPMQIRLIEPYLAEADRRALRDARVTVHPLDARYFVKTQRDRFDLVIARLPEPVSALRARLYTVEFFGELRRAMTDRSVLCMTAAATPADLPAEAAEYLASIRATVRRHFPRVVVGWGDPAQILAATQPGLISTDAAELTARYKRRNVESPLFHPLWFEGATDWLDPEKLQARARQLDDAAAEISTDLRPAVYIQRLALWERMTAGDARPGVIATLRRIRWPQFAALIALGAAVLLIACRLRGRARTGSAPAELNPWAPGATLLSIATTGFATMALSIIWLFAFQNLYGYVYQRIGWIIALFMGGLVIGCWLAGRLAARSSGPASLYAWLRRRLIAVDVLIALLALAVPLLLPVLGSVQNTGLAFAFVEWVVSIMVAVTGALCGAAFALAGGLQLAATGRPGGAAGSIVGADHAGACAGALLTGVLLVPVFGTVVTAWLLAGIKLGSAAALLLTGGLKRTRPN